MAKFKEKLEAHSLRRLGHSINYIADKLSVSKGSISIWCRDIELSPAQIKKLLKSKNQGITRGRLKGALMQKMKRINAIKLAEKEAKKMGSVSKNQFWFAGLALYLAEGSKKMGRVQFTNSDPRVINFMLRWFQVFYGISANNLRCSVLINIIHKIRDEKIKKFWQKYLKIKSDRFTNIRYVKTKQRKIYANYENYYGTFSFRINKSTHLLYKLNALTNRLLFWGNKIH